MAMELSLTFPHGVVLAVSHSYPSIVGCILITNIEPKLIPHTQALLVGCTSICCKLSYVCSCHTLQTGIYMELCITSGQQIVNFLVRKLLQMFSAEVLQLLALRHYEKLQKAFKTFVCIGCMHQVGVDKIYLNFANIVGFCNLELPALCLCTLVKTTISSSPIRVIEGGLFEGQYWGGPAGGITTGRNIYGMKTSLYS